MNKVLTSSFHLNTTVNYLCLGVSPFPQEAFCLLWESNIMRRNKPITLSILINKRIKKSQVVISQCFFYFIFSYMILSTLCCDGFSFPAKCDIKQLYLPLYCASVNAMNGVGFGKMRPNQALIKYIDIFLLTVSEFTCIIPVAWTYTGIIMILQNPQKQPAVYTETMLSKS